MFSRRDKESKTRTKAQLKAQKKSAAEVIWEYIKSFGVALILALIIKTSLVEAYKIPSGSMENTLLIGDFLLANKFLYGAKVPLLPVHLPALREPRPGDIVIFKFPGDRKTNYIKRCIAVGGQTVEIRNKRVFVDGKEFQLPIHGKFTDHMIIPGSPNGSVLYNPSDPHLPMNRDNFGPVRVPANSFFMMGDNRDNSYDSRFWGFVSRNLILGKAMIIHWSWRPDPGAPRITKTDLLAIPKSIGYNILHFFQRVRWHRLATIIK